MTETLDSSNSAQQASPVQVDLGVSDNLEPFDTKQALYDVTKTFAPNHEYCLSSYSSDRELHYELSGAYDNRNNAEQRNTIFKKSDCSFRLNDKLRKNSKGYFINLTHR